MKLLQMVTLPNGIAFLVQYEHLHNSKQPIFLGVGKCEHTINVVDA